MSEADLDPGQEEEYQDFPLEAVVLAGGFGTRLQSVVSDLPKPMAPVAGRPFLEYVLDELIEQGIGRAILAIGYKAELIQAHFGARYRDLELVYSVEVEPLGTGGGILQAVGLANNMAVFVVNGDTLFRTDFAAMTDLFDRESSLLVMALKPMEDFDRYGTVSMEEDSGAITGFQEKQAMAKGMINGGVYLLHRGIFALKDHPPRFSFEKEVLEAEYERGSFHAIPFDTYFIDIGIPEDYERAQGDLAV